MLNRTLPLRHAYKLLAILAMLFSGPLSAQTSCYPVFQKMYSGQPGTDDEAINVAYCKAGGMIICGRTTSYSSGQFDGFLLKLSDNGTPEWTKVIGGSGNDRLIKAVETQDGGFIALGETNSFANIKSETWLVKTDALGNIQWNKRYSKNTSNREKPKDIIQLKDGNYCLALNTDSGTAANNALIVKINPSGNLIWSQLLDHGKNDGVNSLVEQNDTILVGGYATGDRRYAIITKLSVASGVVINANWITTSAGNDEEVIGIESTNSGLAFSTISYYKQAELVYSPLMSYFRLRPDGTTFFQSASNVSTISGLGFESVSCRATSDLGYIYLVNDTFANGSPQCGKVGPYNKGEWGRAFGEYVSKARITGMDITGEQGYLFAGFRNDYLNTGGKNKINIWKTDRIGKTGNCPVDLALNFIYAGNNITTPFTWKISETSTIDVLENTMNSSANIFTVLKSCEGVICETNQNLQDGCNNSFAGEYKADDNVIHTDAVKLSDGSYMLAGTNSYYWNVEPCIFKLKPNGSIAWAKTYSEMLHDGHFVRLAAGTNNTMFVMGQVNFTYNNASDDSALLMKIDYSGNVLWARKYARGTDARFDDIVSTDDGGCVLMGGDISGGGGSGSVTVVIRIDGNGNFVWKKQINSTQLNVQKLLFDNNFLYTCGTSNVYSSTFGPIGQLSITKLDAATGNFVWQKQFRSATLVQSFNSFGLEKVGDSLVASIELSKPTSAYQVKKEAGFVKLSATNGKLYGAFRIPDLTYQSMDRYNIYNTVWSAVSGSDIVFADKAALAGDTSFYLTRISLSGAKIWSKKYGNLKKHLTGSIRHVDDGFLVVGSIQDGQLEWNTQKTNPFVLKVNEKGDIADNPMSATCTNTNYAAAIDTLTLLDGEKDVSSVIDLDEDMYLGYLKFTPFTPYVRDLKNWSTIFCSKVSNCSSVSISGPDSICSIGSPVLYSLTRNAGCDAAALWFTDSSIAKTLAVTDSSILLQYKKAGSGLLRASITSGCTGLSAEKTIFIARQASSLNLGPDTILCTNSKDTLKAVSGFRTYNWSYNGSTDSVAIVSEPGVYMLTVTDFCDKSFTDTVKIKAASFPFTAGPDASKCNQDSVTLTASPGFINYSWQPAYNLQKISAGIVKVFPYVDTLYVVQAEKWPGCFVRDTVNITVHTSVPITLGKDTVICTGQKVTLQASSNFASYKWSTGNDQPVITVQKEGVYSIVGTTADGCRSVDTINISVRALPEVTLDHNSGICNGMPRVLDAGNFVSYIWQDGSSKKTYTTQGTGTYSVQVTDQFGCKGSDTTRISTVFPSPAGFLPADTSFCAYDVVNIHPTKDYRSYNWNNGQTSAAIKITRPGAYWLSVTDNNNCVGIDSINITLKECRTGLFVPNAFTPNNDGSNDQLRGLVYGNIIMYEFKVYNRFGQQVFQTSDPKTGWDGRLKGISQDPGTYVWTCIFRLENSNPVKEKGVVILVR